MAFQDTRARDNLITYHGSLGFFTPNELPPAVKSILAIVVNLWSLHFSWSSIVEVSAFMWRSDAFIDSMGRDEAVTAWFRFFESAFCEDSRGHIHSVWEYPNSGMHALWESNPQETTNGTWFGQGSRRRRCARAAAARGRWKMPNGNIRNQLVSDLALPTNKQTICIY